MTVFHVLKFEFGPSGRQALCYCSGGSNCKSASENKWFSFGPACRGDMVSCGSVHTRGEFDGCIGWENMNLIQRKFDTFRRGFG